MFDVGDQIIIDGVRPFGVEELKYIRTIANFEIKYPSIRNSKHIESELIFTNAGNTQKR